MKPANQKKSKILCQKPGENIVDVTIELASNHVFYVLSSDGEILVYDLTLSKKSCSSNFNINFLISSYPKVQCSKLIVNRFGTYF